MPFCCKTRLNSSNLLSCEPIFKHRLWKLSFLEPCWLRYIQQCSFRQKQWYFCLKVFTCDINMLWLLMRLFFHRMQYRVLYNIRPEHAFFAVHEITFAMGTRCLFAEHDYLLKVLDIPHAYSIALGRTSRTTIVKCFRGLAQDHHTWLCSYATS